MEDTVYTKQNRLVPKSPLYQRFTAPALSAWIHYGVRRKADFYGFDVKAAGDRVTDTIPAVHNGGAFTGRYAHFITSNLLVINSSNHL